MTAFVVTFYNNVVLSPCCNYPHLDIRKRLAYMAWLSVVLVVWIRQRHTNLGHAVPLRETEQFEMA